MAAPHDLSRVCDILQSGCHPGPVDAAFIDCLWEIYATAGLAVHVRRVAAATLKGMLPALMPGLVGPGALPHLKAVQVRILAALQEPSLCVVSANLLSSLVSALRDCECAGPPWPGLLETLAAMMDAAIQRGCSGLPDCRGALLAIEQLAEDGSLGALGVLQGAPSGPAPSAPSVALFPRLLQLMGPSAGSLRLSAARAAIALAWDSPHAASLHLPAYLVALGGIYRDSSASPAAQDAVACVLSSLRTLLSDHAPAVWPCLPEILPLIIQNLARRPGCDDLCCEAGRVICAILAGAGEVDSAVGWDAVAVGRMGPGRSALLPYLPHILGGLLEGLRVAGEDPECIASEVGWGGGINPRAPAAAPGEEEEEAGEGDSATVRTACAGALAASLHVFPEETSAFLLQMVASFQPQLQTRETVEAFVYALGIGSLHCDSFRAQLEPALPSLLPFLTSFLSSADTTPLLRAAASLVLGAHSEWLLRGPGGPGGPAASTLLHCASAFSSKNPACLMSAFSLVQGLLEPSGGLALGGCVKPLLMAIIGALQVCDLDSTSPDLLCTLWHISGKFVGMVEGFLMLPECDDARSALGSFLPGAVKAFAASAYAARGPELCAFLDFAASIIAVLDKDFLHWSGDLLNWLESLPQWNAAVPVAGLPAGHQYPFVFYPAIASLDVLVSIIHTLQRLGVHAPGPGVPFEHLTALGTRLLSDTGLLWLAIRQPLPCNAICASACALLGEFSRCPVLGPLLLGRLEGLVPPLVNLLAAGAACAGGGANSSTWPSRAVVGLALWALEPLVGHLSEDGASRIIMSLGLSLWSLSLVRSGPRRLLHPAACSMLLQLCSIASSLSTEAVFSSSSTQVGGLGWLEGIAEAATFLDAPNHALSVIPGIAALLSLFPCFPALAHLVELCAAALYARGALLPSDNQVMQSLLMLYRSQAGWQPFWEGLRLDTQGQLALDFPVPTQPFR